MYVLGIDTSTMTGGVALLQAGSLLGEAMLNIRTTHSERLLPALEKLLADAGLNVGDLGLISVVTGPGSFTGLRIGVATAKGLSYALQTPLVGVTTLEAYGWQYAFFPGIVVPLIDARRRAAFWQPFRQGKALLAPSHSTLEEVLVWCGSQLNGEFLFVGDGSLNYAADITLALPKAVVPPDSQALLRPSSAAHLGYIRFLAGEATGDAFTLNPTYMRKTEAELKWQEQV